MITSSLRVVVLSDDVTVMSYRHNGWLWAFVEGQPTYPDFWIEVVW